MPTRNSLAGGLLGALLAASYGQLTAADQAPAFDAASVKVSSTEGLSGPGRKGPPPFTSDPTRLSARRLTLKGLISRAYGLDESQVLGGPGWIDSDRYDVDAVVERPAGREQMLVMLQALLGDRFRLKVHRESKLTAQYVLVAAKNGPKFGPRFHASDMPSQGNPQTARDGLKGYTMARLVFFLSDNRDWWDPDAREGAGSSPPPVVDQTGLTGTYDIVLNWTSRKDWLAAFEQDTGLKLELRKIPSEMIVIDSAAKPEPNR